MPPPALLLAEYPLIGLGPTLRIVALLFLLIFAVLIVSVAVALAALPGQIARRRGHDKADAISMAGWLGLPTGILWVLAMVWAYAGGAAPAQTIDDPIADIESALDRLETRLNG